MSVLSATLLMYTPVNPGIVWRMRSSTYLGGAVGSGEVSLVGLRVDAHALQWRAQYLPGWRQMPTVRQWVDPHSIGRSHTQVPHYILCRYDPPMSTVAVFPVGTLIGVTPLLPLLV